MDVLLDTSLFIALATRRTRRSVDEIGDSFVSVITLAELTAGVLAAPKEQLARRLETLAPVESTGEPLAIDAQVARRYAQLSVPLRARGRRVASHDAFIAATAYVHGLAALTQDHGFGVFDDLVVLEV